MRRATKPHPTTPEVERDEGVDAVSGKKGRRVGFVALRVIEWGRVGFVFFVIRLWRMWLIRL